MPYDARPSASGPDRMPVRESCCEFLGRNTTIKRDHPETFRRRADSGAGAPRSDRVRDGAVHSASSATSCPISTGFSRSIQPACQPRATRSHRPRSCGPTSRVHRCHATRCWPTHRTQAVTGCSGSRRSSGDDSLLYPDHWRHPCRNGGGPDGSRDLRTVSGANRRAGRSSPRVYSRCQRARARTRRVVRPPRFARRGPAARRCTGGGEGQHFVPGGCRPPHRRASSRGTWRRTTPR